jgi:hypothetical protein
MNAQGIYSNDVAVNPDFYNWNFVFVKYCDGGSFSGNVAEPIEVNGQQVYYRGSHLLRAVKDHLLDNLNLGSAEDVLIMGTSAGGVGATLNCDRWHDWIEPHGFREFACLNDGGFFLDRPSASGVDRASDNFRAVAMMQNVTGDDGCLAAYPADMQWKCFFLEYTFPYISSRFFSTNSPTDTWALSNILYPDDADGKSCVANRQSFTSCSEQQWADIDGFRVAFLERASGITEAAAENPFHSGYFWNNCMEHTQINQVALWREHKLFGVHSFASVIGNFYFQRDGLKSGLDEPYPSNPSCFWYL